MDRDPIGRMPRVYARPFVRLFLWPGTAHVLLGRTPCRSSPAFVVDPTRKSRQRLDGRHDLPLAGGFVPCGVKKCGSVEVRPVIGAAPSKQVPTAMGLSHPKWR